MISSIKEIEFPSGNMASLATVQDVNRLIQEDVLFDKTFSDEWCKALRSGEYDQGDEYLYMDHYYDYDLDKDIEKPRYCCLGVAGKVCSIGDDDMVGLGDFTDTDSGWDKFDLPREFFSAGNAAQNLLARENDKGIGFEDLAWLIETYLTRKA